MRPALPVHIWEAFLRWCAEQFEAKVGVKVLGMGEFCYRKDVIGGMEFLNPMFILSEGFTGSFGLHDRRPKTQVHAAESIDLDMLAIAGRTTDLLGEVIGKEVVENAIHDIIERIGDVCADPDTYGIVTLDFGFARLFCENKLEFSFGAAAPRHRLSPGRGGGSPTACCRHRRAARTACPPRLASRQADAPLQPHRPHRVRSVCTRTKQDLIPRTPSSSRRRSSSCRRA